MNFIFNYFINNKNKFKNINIKNFITKIAKNLFKINLITKKII